MEHLLHTSLNSPNAKQIVQVLRWQFTAGSGLPFLGLLHCAASQHLAARGTQNLVLLRTWNPHQSKDWSHYVAALRKWKL